MKIIETYFDEVKVLAPNVFSDNRGFFQESYTRFKFEKLGIGCEFVQDNHSYSSKKWTIRGLHFQSSPKSQAKLVRVIQGAMLDVVVDIRKDSPTFKKYVTVELSAENFKQIYIPKGFAHGFCTLTDDCHVCYKVDDYYSHENNSGIIWNDSDLGIVWPCKEPILSPQDTKWPCLNKLFISSILFFLFLFNTPARTL